ncbi:MAG: cupredoxin domain-containing protein [Acidobacteria bacterium]|nr:cupredoxin domain-containing protein [Acidobacteriota bacterium]
MKRNSFIVIIIVLVLAGLLGMWTGKFGAARSARAAAAEQVYVAPGEHDKYYGFLSGGQSGSVFVVGIPSGRLLREVPVFEPRAAYGYALHANDPQRQLLDRTGGAWGDTHHPVLSEKGGLYDGRFLWVNDLANGRLARIRLDYFETDSIIKIPNLQGAHGIAAVSPDTKYIVVNGEFEQPADGLVTNPAPYTSVVAFVDAVSMEVKFEVEVPGNIDIADTSKDGRHAFSTIYNLEQGRDMGSMIQFDRDALAAIDIPAAEAAVAAGKGRVRNGVPILFPDENPGVLTLVPVPKNPHGVNVTPDGRYVMASGKLSPTVTIVDTKTLKIVAEPEVGLGPLHTTFDNRGNAYTSLFLDSQVVKWNIDKAVSGAADYIVDRINVHYNIGHLQAVGGESMAPTGDYLLALNKLSKDQYLPVGPDLPENQEIIDISGEKMKMLASFPTPPEPHDAVFCPAKILAPKVKQVYATAGNAVEAGKESVVRTGPDTVTVRMSMIRSAYTPDHFEVREGDTITFTLTNVETIRDMIHGFALPDHNLHVALPPGATKTITIEAGKPGVYWYYCTNFCSALHLEMRGRMVVQPKDSTITLSDWKSGQNVTGPVPGVPSTGAQQ